MEEHSLKAGAASIDVTPTLGTLINGEFTNRYANKIADRLYTKTLLLKTSQLTLAFVVVDICAMQKDFLDDVKEKIYRETNILPENILISSTHTHSSGSVTDLLMGHIDIAYRKRLPEQIVSSVKEALSLVKPAKLGFGKVDVPEHVLCRRYNMREGYQAFNPVTGTVDRVKTNPFGGEKEIVGSASEVDPEVGYFAVKGLDGKWISLLANYSLHYVGDCDRGTISADYFGYFSRAIAKLLKADESFVGIMSNGTSGEANIWDFKDQDRYPKGNHEKSELIGTAIAHKVEESIHNLVWETNPSLEVIYRDINVRSRKPGPAELSRALSIVADTDYEHIDLDQQGYEQIYAREQVLLNDYPDEVPFPIQAFRIGSGIIGALGGEFFAETGLKLKQVAANNSYFTITLANDYVGYVPPAHELEKGGYETWRCRTSRLASESEQEIRGILKQMILNLSDE